MNSRTSIPFPAWPTLSSWVLAGGALFLVLTHGLLGALLAGFGIYALTGALAKALPARLGSARASQVALAATSGAIVGGLVGAGIWVAGFLSGQGSGPGVGALMLRMADILVELKTSLPDWMAGSLPSSVHHFNTWAAGLLKDNAQSVQDAGEGLLKGLARVVIGMVAGGLVAIARLGKQESLAPLAAAMDERLRLFSGVFSQVVSAQFKISLLNTALTAIFLGCVLPALGHEIPFLKTLVLITFVAGLVPVIGNLVSNTVITVIALSVSAGLALVALAYLFGIHKLEYFLNAKIIGTQIQAKAWELLVAMLAMEAIFGLPGVIAAPIYYAYAKAELRAAGML